MTTPTLHLGFLTVIREPSGYLGGYLVTNQWGRPLEFRLSTPVQPNRVQQILYAETLEPYVCGELIGKTLVDKTGTAVQVVVTDTEAALELRQRVEMPVVFLDSKQNHEIMKDENTKEGSGTSVRSHARYPDDAAAIQETMDKIKGNFDLAEPFQRIREAMAEARKMGVTQRA
ncbi:MAG TPA: hypothetical protein VE988_03735 [Gemmataceae bacterium]|nr:hypothetical protein [Gemmataceae bacterium]